jgi:hypothetical protein
MAAIGHTFDPNSVAPSEDRGPLIPGDYTIIGVKSTIDDTNGNQRFEFEWEVADGPAAKRHLWSSVFYQHTNPTAQEIGQRQFGDICRAVKKVGVSDTDQVLGIPLVATVILKPAGFVEKNGYTHTKAKNEITAYKPLGAVAPRAAVVPQVQQQAAPVVQPTSTVAPKPAAGGMPSWMKHKAAAAPA